MSVNTSNAYGKITISDLAIAKVASLAAMECYGIVETVSRRFTDSLSELFNKNSEGKGVKVTTNGDRIYIDVYVIIKFGVSINANLTDTLIVAVIASDFSSEYDFTAPPAVKLPDPVLPPEGEEEEEQGEEDVLSAILPDFLRKARDEGQ